MFWLPFADSPQELLAAAKKGGDDEVFHDPIFAEQRVSVDENGGVEVCLWRVYEVLSNTSAEELGIVGTSWVASRRERPTIEARVVTPDGRVFELDPTTLMEGAPPEEYLTFSDKYTLSGPLPQVTAGAVVEVVTRLKSSRGPISAHISRPFPLDVGRTTRVLVDVPSSADLEWKLENADVKVRVQTAKRRKYLSVVRERDDPALPFYGDLPPAHQPRPVLWLTTWPDWATVGRTYGEVFEPATPGSPELPRLPRVRSVCGLRTRSRGTRFATPASSWVSGPTFPAPSMSWPKPASAIARRKPPFSSHCSARWTSRLTSPWSS